MLSSGFKSLYLHGADACGQLTNETEGLSHALKIYALAPSADS